MTTDLFDPRIQGWLRGNDRGVSSNCIVEAMTGMPKGTLTGNWLSKNPHDPSDFGRCYRLLKLIPEWRARIGEMHDITLAWSCVAPRWSEIEKIYERELLNTSGRAPITFAFLQALERGSTAAIHYSPEGHAPYIMIEHTTPLGDNPVVDYYIGEVPMFRAVSSVEYGANHWGMQYFGKKPKNNAAAIDLSIHKWQFVVWTHTAYPQRKFTTGACSTCGLCMRHWTNADEDNRTECLKCPIYKQSGLRHCKATPHAAYEIDATLLHAQAELDYLRSLVKPPKEA